MDIEEHFLYATLNYSGKSISSCTKTCQVIPKATRIEKKGSLENWFISFFLGTFFLLTRIYILFFFLYLSYYVSVFLQSSLSFRTSLKSHAHEEFIIYGQESPGWILACFKMTMGSINIMTFWPNMLHDITG